MSKQASEEENKKLNGVEKRLKELSKCELFLDSIFIKDKTARQIIVSAYNKLERQQKEIDEKSTIIMAGAEKVKQLEKEIEERDKYNITTLPFEELKEMIEQNKNISIFGKEYISKDKIREKIKELEEQKEKIKYDGNRCFADYEQFCKNLKFFKEQIDELLEEK